MVPWRPVCPVCPVAPAQAGSCQALLLSSPRSHAGLASKSGAWMRTVRGQSTLTCGALEAGLSRLPGGSCRGMQLSGSAIFTEVSCRACFQEWCLDEDCARAEHTDRWCPGGRSVPSARWLLQGQQAVRLLITLAESHCRACYKCG